MSSIEELKAGKRWVGADYIIILQEGGFYDLNENNLLQAAAVRIVAAKSFDQEHYDDMEERQGKMLAVILSLILYHRFNSGY